MKEERYMLRARRRMIRRILIPGLAAAFLATSAAAPELEFAQPAYSAASKSFVCVPKCADGRYVLRTLRARIHWAAKQVTHTSLETVKAAVIRTTVGTAVIGGRAIRILEKQAIPQPGDTTSSSVSIESGPSNSSSSSFAEQTYDAFFSLNGSTVTETDYTDGILAYDDGSANFAIPSSPPPDMNTAPCPSNVFCSGLTYKFTDCYEIINDPHVHTYQCYHVYSASCSTCGYRVGWWTGSGNSEPGYYLLKMDNRNGMAGCPLCNVNEIDWSPDHTYPGGNPATINLGFSLGGYGISASIGMTLTEYAQSYGPDPNYPTQTQFQFNWSGDANSRTVIGIGGGEAWTFDNRHGYPLYNYATLYYN